jgi:hypothetical protein
MILPGLNRNYVPISSMKIIRTPIMAIMAVAVLVITLVVPHANAGSKEFEALVDSSDTGNESPDTESEDSACLICGKTFESRETLNVHKQREHSLSLISPAGVG